MTILEAEEIASLYEDYLDKSCTCFQGHPPCGKCENQPSDEMYEQALQILWKEFEKEIFNNA